MSLKIPLKSKPDRRPVCFGVIDSREWHIDYSLVPKDKRDQAARAFRRETKSLGPGFGNMVFIYHHETGLIEVRCLARRRKLWIGDAVV